MKKSVQTQFLNVRPASRYCPLHSWAPGFNILESLIMLLLLSVLAMTTAAIYRKGPPSSGWLGARPKASEAGQESAAFRTEKSEVNK